MKSFVSDPGVWRLQTAKFYYLFMKSIYKFLLWWYIQTLHGSWYPHFQYFNMMEFQIDSCYILSLYHPSVFLVTIFISFETLFHVGLFFSWSSPLILSSVVCNPMWPVYWIFNCDDSSLHLSFYLVLCQIFLIISDGLLLLAQFFFSMHFTCLCFIFSVQHPSVIGIGDLKLFVYCFYWHLWILGYAIPYLGTALLSVQYFFTVPSHTLNL